MSKVRVNVKTRVSNSDIRKELDVNGRMCYVLPSYTLPDDVVMNGIKYLADEIEKAFGTLEGTPAPLGHPMVRGQYVSVNHPESYPFISGAINRNVKRENGRVYAEKWVDIEYANRNHPSLVKAIEDKKPIHTSTGLVLDRIEVNAETHKYEAKNMIFDHDAILLNEVGAATPAQGVGIFVNASGEEIEVIESELNSELRDKLESLLPENAYLLDFDNVTLYYDIDGKLYEQQYTDDGLVGEAHEVKRKTVWERIVNALKPKNPVQVNSMTKEEMQEMLRVNSEQNKADVAEAVKAAVEPLKEKIEKIESAQVEANNAALAEKRAAVAKVLGEVVANALAGEALEAAYAKTQTAASLNGGIKTNSAADPMSTYEGI